MKQDINITVDGIIFTGNENTDFITKYLVEHDIPFNTINENPPFFKGKSRKIYYNLLLDDRAGLSAAYLALHKVLEYVEIQRGITAAS